MNKHALDAHFDVGASDIESDNEENDFQFHHQGPQTGSNSNIVGGSSHSDISSCDGLEQVSPEVSPMRNNNRPHKVDALGGNQKRRSSRDLMDGEDVRKESLHMTDNLDLSDGEFSGGDSFADANSNEIVTDDEMSISDDEISVEDDDDYDDDFDENGNYKYSDNEGYEYDEVSYQSDDEITVEDALATIMEGEEEEEEEDEESEDEGEGTKRNGSIHQSLYRFALLNEEEEEGDEHESNHSVELFEMALGGESKSPPKRVRPQGGGFLEEDGEEDLNDSGYFMSKEPLYSSLESGNLDEEDDILTLLRTENWPALNPVLRQLRTDEDEQIRDELTKMDTFGNNTKMYPIHFIVWRAPNSFIKTFISSIPYTYQSETLSRLDSYGNSPLHLACSGLEVDVEDDMIDVSVVEMISECGPETHEMLNKQGESPLALLLTSAALKADPANLANSEATAERLVRSMLEGRTNLIKRKNMFDFKTLLHTAVSSGVHEGVSVALVELSDPSIAVMTDTSKRIPLHYVAGCISGKRPQVRLAEKLLEAQKAGVMAKNTTGETPLHVYVSNISQRIKDKEELNTENVAKMAELLLGSKEDESKCALLAKNNADLSPLHCCAIFDTPKNVMEELKKSHFFEKAAMVTDSNSATPLHLACASSKIRLTQETLSCFGTAEAAVVRDKKSRTPMHVAAENPKMTKQFIKVLADINPKAAKVRNSKGRMPLHVALRKNAKDTVIKALLKVNPKAVKTTFNGRNCIFHEMCEYKNSSSVMKTMLKMYPEGVKVKSKSGNLPLHDAIAFECSIDVVQELLDAYPDGATSKNKNGDTPLHLAAMNKSLEVVELLISVGPKAGIYENKEGKKPLDVAKSVEGNEEVVAFMEAEINEYLEERARQKAKAKSSRKSKEKKRSSRGRSSSEDIQILKDPVEEEVEVAPKKPSSLSKIMSRSSAAKQKRRASGGDAKSIDPDAKQGKKPLRRMLKSFAKVTSPLQSSRNHKKGSSRSSHSHSPVPPERNDEESTSSKKGKRTKSEHIPKERPNRELRRSNSDRALRKTPQESISEENTLRAKLKSSRSFKLSKKSWSKDEEDEDNRSRSSHRSSRKSLFSKKSRGSNDGDGSTDGIGESGSNDDVDSPRSSRKIRSGRKKESKSSSNEPQSPGANESSAHSSRRSSGHHRSPRRSKSDHKRRTAGEVKADFVREDAKPTSESSLTPDAPNSVLSLDSETSNSRKKSSRKSRRKSKPDYIKEEAPHTSESSLTKTPSESSTSASKHASESLETKHTTVDPPGESAGPGDPPASTTGSSVDTEDEWF